MMLQKSTPEIAFSEVPHELTNSRLQGAKNVKKKNVFCNGSHRVVTWVLMAGPRRRALTNSAMVAFSQKNSKYSGFPPASPNATWRRSWRGEKVEARADELGTVVGGPL